MVLVFDRFFLYFLWAKYRSKRSKKGTDVQSWKKKNLLMVVQQ